MHAKMIDNKKVNVGYKTLDGNDKRVTKWINENRESNHQNLTDKVTHALS